MTHFTNLLIGLAFLLFLAGLEIGVHRLRGRTLRTVLAATRRPRRNTIPERQAQRSRSDPQHGGPGAVPDTPDHG